MNLIAQVTCTRSLFYREIPLTQGQVALVDIEDYEWLNGYTWCAAWNEHTSSFYAIRSLKLTPGRNGKNYTVRMHREIMGLERFDPRRVDHVEPSQTLDNRRFNLRIATLEQNMHNRRMNKNNKTGFKGVYLVRATGLYGSSVGFSGKTYHCGFFSSAIEASEARSVKAQELHGEYARLA